MYIGKNVSIINSIIGQNVTIGDNSLVKDSVVLSNVKLKKNTYLIKSIKTKKSFLKLRWEKRIY